MVAVIASLQFELHRLAAHLSETSSSADWIRFQNVQDDLTAAIRQFEVEQALDAQEVEAA